MSDTSPHSDTFSDPKCSICGCSLKGVSEINGRCSPCFWNRAREQKDALNAAQDPVCVIAMCGMPTAPGSDYCGPHTDYMEAIDSQPAHNPKVHPATKALKFDTDKLPLDLLPFEALEEIALVLQHGAKKYNANNWRKGFIYSRPFAAILRHLFAYWKGEDLDQDSGLHHLAHAGCELLFLLSFIKTETGVDDRYKKESANA